MNNDIVPSLLEEIQKQFDEEIKANEKIKSINKTMPHYKAIRGIIISDKPLITKAGSGKLYRLSFFCKRIRSFFKKGNTRKYQ